MPEYSAIALACSTALGMHPVLLQTSDASESARIQQVMERYADAGRFSGAVAVARRGETIHLGAHGLANRELGVLCTPQTRFQIGSITKTITATMALHLVDRGELALDSTLAELMPDVAFPKADEITLERLLTHTSGLQRDIADYPPGTHRFPDRVAKINGDFFSLDELVQFIAARPLSHPPGERYSYSSDGYTVLGSIVARTCGSTYADALHREFFAPLGMADSGYVPQTTVLPGRASGYVLGFGGHENARPLAVSPAGGIFSTVGDLLQFDRALQGDDLISPEAKERAWSRSEFITAYGWKVRADVASPQPDALLVQASGSVPGFFSLFTRTLSDQLCVVLLANVQGPTFHLDSITADLLALLRGGRDLAAPKRSAAFDLADRLASEGTTRAMATFREWRSSDFAEHYVDEHELNLLGYHWLSTDAVRAAAVLNLAVECFPRSANAHDSLGEAMERSGDLDAALASHRRAVALARTYGHPDLGSFQERLSAVERKLK